MRKMTARFLWAVCIVGIITGGYAKGKTMQAARALEKEDAEPVYEGFGSRGASVEIIPGSGTSQGPKEESEDTILSAQVQETDPGIAPKAEQAREMDQSEEKKQPEHSEEDQEAKVLVRAGSMEMESDRMADFSIGFTAPAKAALEDTVEYVPSKKEEKTETVFVELVVDENDPRTYETIKKEIPVPSKYVNRAGDVRYEYKDGIWYEYIYSSGDIILDEPSEKLALRFLNLDGSYNGYEVMEIKCTVEPGQDGELQYGYHVRYRRTIRLEKRPEELDRLWSEGLIKTSDVVMIEVEEKVPVMIPREIATGNYDYYGWQTLEDSTYYFDKDGEKVSGSQVIQGVRHEFDENGIKISRTGVDVSEENGEIDWMRVGGSSVDFAMIRCAYWDLEEGILKTDTRAEENIVAAKAAGIETGLFVLSRVTTKKDAMKAADFAVAMAERHGLTGNIALVIPEEDPKISFGGADLDPDSQTAFVKSFCNVVSLSGFQPVVCADADWAAENLKMEELDGCLFWISQYDAKITYTGPYAFWRYTDCGSVDGISGYTGLTIAMENLGGTSK